MALATKTKNKSPLTHKKRSGQHHRKSKHYMQAYWPYIPMLLIVGLGLLINSIWSAHNVLGATSDFSAHSLLISTNEQRAVDKESQLSIDPLLSHAAQAKADDMVATDYWSHTSPDGKTPWTFIAASGYSYERAGENLAYGFSGATQTVNGWMNSTEHRANILNAQYQNVGFGVATSSHYQGHGPETVVVAMYGQPASSTAADITFKVSPPTSATSTTAPDVLGARQEPSTRFVSRIQLLTGGQAPWSLLAATAIMSAALMAFVLRHGWRLHRLVTRGELFVLHHPILDVIFVLLATVGFVVTRTSGLIR